MWKLTVAISFLISCAFCQNGVNVSPQPAVKLTGSVAPHWDPESRSLYWTNFLGVAPAICRFSFDKNATFCANLPGSINVNFIIPNAVEGTFTIGNGNAVQIIKWDGVSKLATFISNQFFVDPSTLGAIAGCGRSPTAEHLYVGGFSLTYCLDLDYSQFNVYRYDKQSGLVKIINGTLTTGIAFDYNKNIMYLVDPCQLFLNAYDWDRSTGDVRNPRLVFKFTAMNSNISSVNRPLSLDIDTSGNLYTATEDGTVLIIDPVRKTVINTIKLPTKGTAGLTIGGPNLDILYMVTAILISNYDTGSLGYVSLDGAGLFAVTGVNKTFTESNPRLTVFSTQS